MKIYIAIKYHPDHSNRELIETLAQHFESQGHTTVCAVRDFELWGAEVFAPKELIRMAFDAIEGSDLLLVEASEKGMGVGIEAGYASARGKPIVTIAREGADISANLSAISERVIMYSAVDDVLV